MPRSEGGTRDRKHESEEERERLEAAVLASGAGVWDWDISTGRVHFSDRFLELLGCERVAADPALDTWLSRVHRWDRLRLSDLLESKALDGAAFEEEYRCIWVEDEIRWHIVRGRVLFSDDGKPVRVAGTVHDVTERRRAQELGWLLTEALAQSKELVLITGSKGSIEYVNPAVELLTGLSLDQVVGMDPRSLCVDESLQSFESICEAAEKEGRGRGQLRVKGFEGARHLVETTASPVLDQDGRVRCYFSVSHDVTAEEARRQRKAHVEKMDAVSRLASALAHDFNNHLTVIETGTRFALRAVEPDSQLAEDIKEVQDAGRRAAELTSELRIFDTRQVIPDTELDVGEVATQAEGTLAQVLGDAIELSIRVDEPGLMVNADRSQLERIFVNLGINARDAMPEVGSFSVVVERVVRTLHDPLTGGTRDLTAHALLTVTDTGVGIDPQHSDRIFEPFFTTKIDRPGLGLSTVYGIVEQLGGMITVDSEPGKGAVFRIELPLAESSERQSEA